MNNNFTELIKGYWIIKEPTNIPGMKLLSAPLGLKFTFVNDHYLVTSHPHYQAYFNNGQYNYYEHEYHYYITENEDGIHEIVMAEQDYKPQDYEYYIQLKDDVLLLSLDKSFEACHVLERAEDKSNRFTKLIKNTHHSTDELKKLFNKQYSLAKDLSLQSFEQEEILELIETFDNLDLSITNSDLLFQNTNKPDLIFYSDEFYSKRGTSQNRNFHYYIKRIHEINDSQIFQIQYLDTTLIKEFQLYMRLDNNNLQISDRKKFTRYITLQEKNNS